VKLDLALVQHTQNNLQPILDAAKGMF